jgi:hypothetical protein
MDAAPASREWKAGLSSSCMAMNFWWSPTKSRDGAPWNGKPPTTHFETLSEDDIVYFLAEKSPAGTFLSAWEGNRKRKTKRKDIFFPKSCISCSTSVNLKLRGGSAK